MTFDLASLLQILFGSILAAIIALAAYRARSLSRSGAWGALLTGVIIFGLGGWQWAILLLAFFISSSALTRLFGRKKSTLNEKFDKGGVRDLAQVLANGGVASLFAGLHFFLPDASWTWMGFAAAMAAVNADTWATELGVLNPSAPRLVTTWKPVERGTSGGVSLYGSLAAAGGSAFIALLAVLCSASLHLEGLPASPFALFGIILLAGVVGAFFDSLLGATLQAIYRCPQCAKDTEKHPRHTCGTPTERVRGLAWLNNDLVNVGCSLAGAVIGLLL